MGNKREVFFPALLHLHRTLSRVRLQCQADRMIKDTVNDMKRSPLQAHSVAITKIVNATPKDIVFCNHLFNIKSIFDTLNTMSGGAHFLE